MRTLTIYTKKNCPYCELLKMSLDTKNMKYEEIDVTNNKELIEFLKSNGHRTVPQIYYKNHLFVKGGYEGFIAMSSNDIEKRFQEIEKNSV
ncbi:MAG: glutaredoxin family protein [Candidatus Dojkabacteria bacterium]|nr:glutaredoxin family protein [Candidatus Dojkabacteria bacterium]